MLPDQIAELNHFVKATSVRGVTLTAAHLGSFLNFAQLAHMAKFKIEPRYAAVTVMPVTEVAIVSQSLIKKMKTNE